MKKTVQIVTIPLNKEGWDKGDLLKTKNRNKTIFSISSEDYGTFMSDEMIKNSFKAQQLLVLSDDEIQEGDTGKSEYLNNTTLFIGIEWADYMETTQAVRSSFKKVIASYPQIEGTLPISKETVQAWIDAGTPEEGSVEVVDWNCLRPDICKCYNQQKFYPYCKYYKDSNGTKLDSHRNILLEFGKEITRSMQGYSYGDFEDETKPSIPTNEEILNKCLEHSNNLYNSNDKCKDNILSEYQLWENCLRDYEAGYKQALKDLGHKN